MARRLDEMPLRAPLSPSGGLLRVRANGVTVGADDVALRDLFEQANARCEHRPAPRKPERLSRSISMVEVHLMWLECATAVLAGNPAKLPKELERRALTRHHAIDLALAVTAVVADGVWTVNPRA